MRDLRAERDNSDALVSAIQSQILNSLTGYATVHIKNWFRGTSVYGAASRTADADVMMGRPYINVTRIPVYVVLEKVATGEAAARLVPAMKFVAALECFDFR